MEGRSPGEAWEAGLPSCSRASAQSRHGSGTGPTLRHLHPPPPRQDGSTHTRTCPQPQPAVSAPSSPPTPTRHATLLALRPLPPTTRHAQCAPAHAAVGGEGPGVGGARQVRRGGAAPGNHADEGGRLVRQGARHKVRHHVRVRLGVVDARRRLGLRRHHTGGMGPAAVSGAPHHVRCAAPAAAWAT